MRFLSLLVGALFLAACGGVPPAAVKSESSAAPKTFTAADLFPVKPGDKWTMVNDLGDHTFWEVESVPSPVACEEGEIIALHISKDADRTYWLPNLHGAEDRFHMLHLADGSWRGIQDKCSVLQPNIWNTQCGTVQWHPVAGKPLPYLVVPSAITEGQKIEMLTEYQWYRVEGVQTNECLKDPLYRQPENTYWSSTFTVTTVDTPAYKGIAVVNEEWEGPNGHEKWYFAPGVGLVQIDSLTIGHVVTIKRIP